MTRYDVFNGDADGICALIQLRLAEPASTELITGVKRDIGLLERIRASAGDEILVLDVSMDTNGPALRRLLEEGARVRYFDHHFPGEIPDHAGLEAVIDTAPETCTSLLVDAALDGRFRPWAIVAAFGDNLASSARAAAEGLGLSDAQLERLEMLGICINYNGYGSTLEDLHIHPAALYRQLVAYASPLDLIGDADSPLTLLEAGYLEDMNRAAAADLLLETPAAAALVLPDEAWARRVSGVYGNDLANAHPERAHAVLTSGADGSWRISVRAPLARRSGADVLCRRWPTGGGRSAAAGINALPADDLDAFLADFSTHWA
ncbi:MAG: DHH family phosphoesterase [Pseudomonadales bacterium]|jgi:hypothetical protein|nr:DHH family phosphoesterase [Pseudomonadales bacterium]